MNIKLGQLSGPISRDQAIDEHLGYLLEPTLHILTPGNMIAHSLYVDEKDLATLFEYGKKGMRLYFCKHATDNALNIILVPVDIYGNNCVETPLNETKPPIINTLRPCPDDCPPLVATATGHTPQSASLSEKDLNCIEIDDDCYWYKPNQPAVGTGYTWYDEHNTPVADPRP